jgi:hypothetical protein
MKILVGKPMLKIIAVLLMAGVIAVAQGQETSGQAEEMEAAEVSNGGQASLRGLTQLDVTKRPTLSSPSPGIAAP